MHTSALLEPEPEGVEMTQEPDGVTGWRLSQIVTRRMLQVALGEVVEAFSDEKQDRGSRRGSARARRPQHGLGLRGFPVHARIDPLVRASATLSSWLPRARGDRPQDLC